MPRSADRDAKAEEEAEVMTGRAFQRMWTTVSKRFNDLNLY